MFRSGFFSGFLRRINEVFEDDVVEGRGTFAQRTRQVFAVKGGVDSFLVWAGICCTIIATSSQFECRRNALSILTCVRVVSVHPNIYQPEPSQQDDRSHGTKPTET